MRRKLIVAIGIVAGSGLIYAAVPATASTHLPRTFSQKNVTDLSSTDPVCMYDDNVVGDHIRGAVCANSAAQTFTTENDNMCSGGHLVETSPACPFPNGSGLNTTYKGDDIDWLYSITTNVDTAEVSSFLTVESSIQDPLVVDGNCSGSCRLINPLQSTDSSHVATVCGEGGGNGVKFEWSPAGTTLRCDWEYFTP